MRISGLGRKIALTLTTAVAMLASVPQAQAQGGALCTAFGNRFDDTTAVYDLNCAGSPELTGAWHLQEVGGVWSGTAPGGGTVDSGTVTTTIPICVAVGGSYSYCKTVRVRVCVDSWCRWVSVTICISYNLPRVEVCVETSQRGPFNGRGVIDDSQALAA